MGISKLRASAIAWCALMALGTVATMAAAAPVVLTAVFAGVWVFGAAMLWQFPRFGAVGTALYGLILAADIVAMHGTTPTTIALALGSLAGTGLAIAVFMELRRG